MKPCSPQLRFARLAVAAAVATLFSACTWNAWIPGQSQWNPKIVVDPANALQQLKLDSTYVDELNCYARRCQKRFRLIVDRPGQLTVQGMLDLTSEDQQVRMVLENTRGVIGQDGTGRGVRTDVTSVAVRTAVKPGTYFVLLQSLGGRIPYELTATLTPDPEDASPPVAAVAIPAEPRRLDLEPRRFTKVEMGPHAGGGYDPAVVFSGIRTFTFPRPPRPGDPVPAGTPLETPGDRQIRRFLAEGLELKGFRQAMGGEEAHLVVGFFTGGTSGIISRIPVPYRDYDDFQMGQLYEVDNRGTLVVDIVEVETDRIAWHAWTTKGIGPGITYGAKTTALLREAVAEVLAGFPPH
jgi:hypothetical protein